MHQKVVGLRLPWEQVQSTTISDQGDSALTPLNFCYYSTTPSIKQFTCYNAGNLAGVRVMGESSFRSVWHQCTPHILFMTPRTDVCDRCEVLRRGVMTSLTEQDKLAACTLLSNHIATAQRERDHYRKLTQTASDQLKAIQPLPSAPQQPCSTSALKTHYTFDFAQNVCIPHEFRQVGPIYFKVPRKVQISGVNSEAIPAQINYLLDETDTIGPNGSKSHGPNSVVTLLHHYFEHHGLGEKECALAADNCCAQNKNKTVFAYLAWRSIAGLHESIEIHFMITGHTRCLVDGCFGLLKRSYRRNNVYSMSQLADVVDSSAGRNAAQVIPGSGLVWREWDRFFMRFFKPVPGISKMHYMRTTRTDPGVLFVKEAADSPERQVQILKVPSDELLQAGLPSTISPGGLSAERKLYLYSQIREHVPPQYQEEVSPAPS